MTKCQQIKRHKFSKLISSVLLLLFYQYNSTHKYQKKNAHEDIMQQTAISKV